MRGLVQFGCPLRVIWDVVVEKEGGSQERLHFLLGLREGERLDRLLAAVGQLPSAVGDFISEKGDLLVADERLLDLENNAELRAAGNDTLELVGGVFVVIGQNQEVVEDDDGPVWEILEVEDILDNGLEDSGSRSDSFRQKLGANETPRRLDREEIG